MIRADKNHVFRMYSIFLKDAAVADEVGFYEKADSAYWMAATYADELGFEAPESVLCRAKKEQRRIDEKRAAA